MPLADRLCRTAPLIILPALIACAAVARTTEDDWARTARPAPPIADTFPAPPPPAPVRLVLQAPAFAAITATAWSPDVRLFAGAANNGQVLVCNTKGEVVERRTVPLASGAVVWRLTLAADGTARAQSWYLTDRDNPPSPVPRTGPRYGLAGYDHHWRIGSPPRARTRWVDAPPGILALPLSARLDKARAAWRYPPPPASSPDGRWVVEVRQGFPFDVVSTTISVIP